MKSLFLTCIESIDENNISYEEDEIESFCNEMLSMYKMAGRDWDDVLVYASNSGRLDAVQRLVENGIKVSNRALIGASIDGHLCVIKYLVSVGPISVHIQNEEIFRLACKNGYLDIIEYLVENGVDIHLDDEYALHWASCNGHLNVVEYLVKNGACVCSDNNRAIILASDSGHLDVVQYLVENDANGLDHMALLTAVENGRLDIVKYLVEIGHDIHSIPRYILRRTSILGHFDIIEYIISKGFDRHAFNDGFSRWALRFLK